MFSGRCSLGSLLPGIFDNEGQVKNKKDDETNGFHRQQVERPGTKHIQQAECLFIR